MYIGIDLGGTNIAAAVVDGECGIIRQTSIPTNAQDGQGAVMKGLRRVCETLGTAEVRSIGIGVPGAVNANTGVVEYTPNLPLSGVNITRELADSFGIPVFLGNDANCAALGEALAGGAANAESVVFITLGTGVGGGIILGKKLYTGAGGRAGEFGHMRISSGGRKCGCGQRGCFEAYASATGLIKTAVEYMKKHKDCLLWEMTGGDVGRITGKTVFDALRKGDETAAMIVGMYIKHLAAGLVNIINIFEPEMLCIGGGISGAWDVLEKPLTAAVDSGKYSRYSDGSRQTKIVKAGLGSSAGIIGAARLESA